MFLIISPTLQVLVMIKHERKLIHNAKFDVVGEQIDEWNDTFNYPRFNM